LGESTAFRFFNSLDVVPNAWASLATVETYYPPLVSASLPDTSCRQFERPLEDAPEPVTIVKKFDAAAVVAS
jgi:hypothetical protein